MAVSNLDLYDEIMRVLIETPDGGAAEPKSGLYTREDIKRALSEKLQEFNLRGQIKGENGYESPAVSGQKSVQIPPDASAILQVSFKDSQDVWNVIPNGSTVEVSSLVDGETSTALPGVYVLDTSPALMITLNPPPNADSEVMFTYIEQPSAVSTPPTVSDIDCPDDFTPFIKYGAFQVIFSKSGETFDPLRAEVAQQLYDLGVETARERVIGS